MEMTAGIYLIANRLTGDRYLGQSANIENRWKAHQQQLRDGKHHTRLLQQDWQRYGVAVFEFSILQVIDSEMLESSKYHPRFRLQHLYSETFKLDPALLNLTSEEQAAITSYLEMNRLLVQCKQEASRVSPQTWEAILATMLLPSDDGKGGNLIA
jgi:group I intron endonuclease